MSTQKIKGKVKWFNITKGYGFITGEDGKDTFVHFSGIDKGRTYTGLNIDDEVEFEITNGEKGPQAENVVLLSDPNAKPKSKSSKK